MKRSRSETENEECLVTWKRTENKANNLMHLYETGQKHDCTLKVGNKQQGYKEFQCHKLILSGASSVLQSMFLSELENQQDPMQPLLIKDVAPKVFDLAMKFIYGGLQDFGDVFCAIDIYKFALKFDMSRLTEVSFSHLSNLNYDASHIFAFYALLFEKNGGQEEGSLMMECWKKINDSPAKAFDSQCWLDVSQECAMQVLQSDQNQVDEVILFRAAMHWAWQTLSPNCRKDITDYKEVVIRMNSLLKFIRFGAFPAETFLSLFDKKGALGFYSLNANEKYRILACIATKSPTRMPSNYFCRNMESRKVVDYFEISTPYKFYPAQPCEKADLFTLCFSVDKDVNLHGAEIHFLDSVFVNNDPVKVTMLDLSGNNLKEEIVASEQTGTCTSSRLLFLSCSLKAHRLYKLYFPRDETKVLTRVAKLHSGDECVRSDPEGLNVTFSTQTLHVLISGLTFTSSKKRNV